jgi:hypothetical protein
MTVCRHSFCSMNELNEAQILTLVSDTRIDITKALRMIEPLAKREEQSSENLRLRAGGGSNGEHERIVLHETTTKLWQTLTRLSRQCLCPRILCLWAAKK